MTIIEGIGDEVTHFFFALIVIVVTLIAWRSTHIMEQPFIRTVLIVQRRRRRFQRRLESPRQLLEAANITSRLQDTVNNENQQSTEEQCATCSKASVSNAETTENIPEGPRVVDVDDESLPAHDVAYVGTYVERMSGQTFTTRLVRSPNMIFTHSNSEEETTPDEAAPPEPVASEAQSVESEKDLDSGEDANSITQEAEAGLCEEDSSSEMGNIRIRLKYLNDDQKLVEGRLAEPLGDFKRRHFGLELAADKLVRLVYNGQVLSSDSQTLQGYGLFDNCVVHCLVHQQRSPPVPSSTSDSARSPQEGESHRDWDLGHLLFFSLSLILGLAWYCRYQYAQLFSATTTVALVGLSGILAVSLVGTYLPDQDGIRHQT